MGSFGGHDAFVAILSGLTAGRELGLLLGSLGLIHRLLEAAMTNSSTCRPPPSASRRASDPKVTVGGQSQGMWWSSEARPTFCVT
ncbi:hypothetical protein CEP54_006838 [Fusarium duplospermum]|uniref:Uncharacterized protein n=1 Tax=Fusarium duplospermum TaxID=1325734 RepID=A0A428Q500_9HYPO|nr:hypothetical protein CEP54_006838 [Fusarium duplospermum]